jgi:hypothetical protein
VMMNYPTLSAGAPSSAPWPHRPSDKKAASHNSTSTTDSSDDSDMKTTLRARMCNQMAAV